MNDVMFIIVSIFIVIVFGFTIAMIVSPKLRGKMMSREFNSMSCMIEESKDDLAKLSGTAVGIKKKILDENEEVLMDIARKEAKIKGVGIKSAARSIREGLTAVDSIYCKHCGSEIDSDSKFCKKCGKKQ